MSAFWKVRKTPAGGEANQRNKERANKGYVLKPDPTVGYWNLIPLRKLGVGWESRGSYTLASVSHCSWAVTMAHPARCMQAKGLFYSHRHYSDRKNRCWKSGSSRLIGWGDTIKTQLLSALLPQQKKSKTKSSLNQNLKNPMPWINFRLVPVNWRH